MLSKLMWLGGRLHGICVVAVCVVCGGVLRRSPMLSKLMWLGGRVYGICGCLSLKFRLSQTIFRMMLSAEKALLSSAPWCSDLVRTDSPKRAHTQQGKPQARTAPGVGNAAR